MSSLTMSMVLVLIIVLVMRMKSLDVQLKCFRWLRTIEPIPRLSST
jgi:hypothetical protein